MQGLTTKCPRELSDLEKYCTVFVVRPILGRRVYKPRVVAANTGSTDSARSSSGCIDLSLYVCGCDGGRGDGRYRDADCHIKKQRFKYWRDRSQWAGRGIDAFVCGEGGERGGELQIGGRSANCEGRKVLKGA